MTRRKRWALGAGLVGCAAVATLVAFPFITGPTPEGQFGRIELGMTCEQVEALLGEPHERERFPEHFTFKREGAGPFRADLLAGWFADGGPIIHVTFHENRVTWKQMQSRETFWNRLRRALGL